MIDDLSSQWRAVNDALAKHRSDWEARDERNKTEVDRLLATPTNVEKMLVCGWVLWFVLMVGDSGEQSLWRESANDRLRQRSVNRSNSSSKPANKRTVRFRLLLLLLLQLQYRSKL